MEIQIYFFNLCGMEKKIKFKNLQAYEWDVIKQMEQKEQEIIPLNVVAFVGGGTRYIISVDKETGNLAIYKTSLSGLDSIIISPQGNNKIIIE